MIRDGERVPSYDVMRLVATVCVVFIHVSAYSLQLDGPAWPWLLSANRHLIRYAVPAFFLITGALVWGRSWGEHTIGHYSRFIQRRARVVLLPYFVWTAAYVLCPLAMGATRTLPQVLVGLVTGETWYHLYFVPAIMIVYALTPLADRIARISPEVLVVLALVAHMTLPLVFDGRMPFVPAAIERVVASAAIYLPYAAVGSLLARRSLEGPTLRRTWPALLAGSLWLMANRTLLMPSDAILYRSLTAVAALGVLISAFGACSTLAGWRPLRVTAERLSSYTYGVYLAHPFLIEGLGLVTASGVIRFIWRDHTGIWLTLASVLALSLVIGWAQSRLLDRRPPGRSGSGTVTM